MSKKICGVCGEAKTIMETLDRIENDFHQRLLSVLMEQVKYILEREGWRNNFVLKWSQLEDCVEIKCSMDDENMPYWIIKIQRVIND